MRTELLFLRHGESLGNQLKIMAGQHDVDLTDRGVEQALASAEYLKKEKIYLIFSSDLVRAYKTAQKVAEKCNLDVKSVSKGLREIYLGEFEGLGMAYIKNNLDKNFNLYFTSAFGVYQFPGGESTYEAGKRFYDEVVRIAEENKGKKILIASHAGVIRSFWGIISDISREDLGNSLQFPTNASICRANYEDGSFTPISYSESEHLKSVGFIDYSKPRI